MVGELSARSSNPMYVRSKSQSPANFSWLKPRRSRVRRSFSGKRLSKVMCSWQLVHGANMRLATTQATDYSRLFVMRRTL